MLACGVELATTVKSTCGRRRPGDEWEEDGLEDASGEAAGTLGAVNI